MTRDCAHSILIPLCCILFPLLPAMAGCSHSPEAASRPGIISTSLRSVLDTLKSAGTPVEVVVTLSDTTGVAGRFPQLRIAGRRVATGRLTRAEIDELSRLPQVEFIDKSRTYKPLPTL